MLIESISIRNFRQFLEEVGLKFSTDKDRNVTVIHGPNGSGKTSLLNAFKWCFYGQTDFDTLNEKILNEAVIQQKGVGGIVEIRVAVKFSHENRKYCAIRQQRFKCISQFQAEPIEDSNFNLDVTAESGETKRSRSPSFELQAILPGDLQPYFFFNGERIEHIAGINQSGQVRDAIRRLMGLELVDRALVHLNKVKKHYRQEIKEEVSEEQRQIHNLVQDLEEAIERYKTKVDESRRNEDQAKAELKRVERELKRFEQSRALQEQRDELERQLKENLDEIDRIRGNQRKLIDDYGFLAVPGTLFEACKKLVDENRKKGMLPFGIREQFIDDRIEMGVCICGTLVLVGSNEHKSLLDTRRTAGSEGIESNYTGVASLLRNHEEVIESFRIRYQVEAQTLSDKLVRNEDLRRRSDEISSQLIAVDDVKIAKLECEHRALELTRDQEIAEKGSALKCLADARTELEEQNQLLKRLDEKKSIQNIAMLRMNKTAQMIESIEDLREALTNQVRLDLSRRVNETFSSIIRKPVRAEIDSDYCLQVLKITSAGDEYLAREQSTGERQVTSLSFISSIIALAKEKHGQKTVFFNGGLYPLVMDSPFGALDDDYREKVASKVAELAEQVIMFVSNSQWHGRVKKACEQKVGVSYQLVYHAPGLLSEKESEYKVRSTNGFEYSTIEEVVE